MLSRSSNLTTNRITGLFLLVSFLLAFTVPTADASAANLGVSSTGLEHLILQQEDDDRLDEFPLDAPQLQVSQRTIQVYLPPDYYESEKSYPVIYLHDGGLLFNPPTSRDCHYDEKLDSLFENGKIEGIIAVGIFSSSNRWDEYSPWVNDNMHAWIVPQKAETSEGGEGDAYLDFIINTLKPKIDSSYRTLTDRENTAIGGFSMGGLISLYAGLNRPDIFSKVLAVSPAVWFAESGATWLSDNQLINYINTIEVPQDVAFYIDIGTNEWEGEPVNAIDALGNPLTYPYVWVDGADAVFNALEARQVPENNLILVVDEGGIHEPSSWAGRFGKAIRWLFDGREADDEEPSLVTVIPPAVAEIVPTYTPVEVSTSVPEAGSTLVSPNVSDPQAEENGGNLNLALIAVFLVVMIIILIILLVRQIKIIKRE